MEVKLPALLENYDKPTDQMINQPTNQPIDPLTDHVTGKFSPPIKADGQDRSWMLKDIDDISF